MTTAKDAAYSLANLELGGPAFKKLRAPALSESPSPSKSNETKGTSKGDDSLENTPNFPTDIIVTTNRSELDKSSDEAISGLLVGMKAGEPLSTDAIQKEKQDFENEEYPQEGDEEELDEEYIMDLSSCLIQNITGSNNNSPNRYVLTGDATTDLLDSSSSKSLNNILDSSSKSPKLDAPRGLDMIDLGT